MAKGKVFISYSHKDKQYRDKLMSFLGTVPSIADAVWVDVQDIGIGDKFHGEIQQALAQSRAGILLLSNHFFTSSYIKQHELPFLIREAEQQGVKLGCLYLTKIPNATLGQFPELLSRIGANSPDKPLDKLSKARRNEIYADLTDWIDEQLKHSVTAPTISQHRQQRPRFELAITMREQRDHWQHSFSLPQAPDFSRPALKYPQLETLSDYAITGDDLFQLLFGADEQKSGELLGATFGVPDIAEPTREALRVRLLTDDERLCALPWADIAYRGRPLSPDGWTVELHAGSEHGFPEYPSHTCYFPGRVVLLASQDTVGLAHFQDLQHFFQRGWQENPTPKPVASEQALRAELSAGSARLVYYFGPASRDGLLLEGADQGERFLPWIELAELLKTTRSVSLLFLNLLGEPSRAAALAGRILLQGAKAVLFQCGERAEAASGARAALSCLRDIFTGEQLDPVVALHRHRHRLVTAWTGYSSWRTIAPQRLENPDLVDLLLDRRSQRAELSLAKEDFYDPFPARRIYQAVAFGAQRCRVSDFPNTAGQHLKSYGRKDQEVVIQQALQLTPSLTSSKRIDDAVRRQIQFDPRGSFVNALLRQEASASSDFWFFVLGWTLSKPVTDTATGAAVIEAVTDWCHSRLGDDIAAVDRKLNVRVISIIAIETDSAEVTEALEATVAELSERYEDEDAFHIGRLDRLAGVRREDLNHYFNDKQICHCDDRYRKDFPRLLLGGRREMPFDEAVGTIKRGDPDNWGNLFEELTEKTGTGEWPPADNDRNYWESADER